MQESCVLLRASSLVLAMKGRQQGVFQLDMVGAILGRITDRLVAPHILFHFGEMDEFSSLIMAATLIFQGEPLSTGYEAIRP